MSFFSELKRRNVIRAGILYLISAWLLLQLTDVLSSLLSAPDWTGSVVVILLAVGFFPTLAFAWVFELTSEGLKRESEIDHSVSLAESAEQRTNTLIIALLILAIGAVAVDRLVPERAPTSQSADEVQVSTGVAATESGDSKIDVASIAVLPFADLSQAEDQRYFTDGISEELLNVLAHVDGLRVASRTSSFGYRDTSMNVSAIGKELNVRHVLEGSVRKDAQRIRITAQLIDASTDKHLWSDTYDRELRDIFAIQEEIANAIVKALVDKLGINALVDQSSVVPGIEAITVIPVTENMDAYELYLQGWGLFQARTSLPLSVELLQQATALDPGFARAWESLAAVSVVIDQWVGTGTDHMPLARNAALKAIELDPSLSLAYAVLGATSSFPSGGHDYVAAIQNYDRSLANDPKNTTTLLWRGNVYRDVGYFDESGQDFIRCLDIDPDYLICKHHLATLYASAGDDSAALSLFEESMAANFRSNDPDFVGAYVRTGQRQLATLLAASLFPSLSQAPVSDWIAALEDPDGDQQTRLARFVRWSDDTEIDIADRSALLIALKAYDRVDLNHFWTAEAMWLPEATAFRQTRYFQDLIRESGILKFWQSQGFPPQCEPVGEDGFSCD